FKPPGRSAGGRQTARPAPPAAVMSVEGLRAAVPSAARRTALLQRRVPSKGSAMVALEGATELSSDGGRKRETQPAEPALSPASQKPPASSAGRNRSGSREGNHS